MENLNVQSVTGVVVIFRDSLTSDFPQFGKPNPEANDYLFPLLIVSIAVWPSIHHEGTCCTISAHHAPSSVGTQILHPQDSLSSLVLETHQCFWFLFPGFCLIFLPFSFFLSLIILVSFVSALAVEEQARQLQMKVHSYRPSASHDPETDLKTKREVSIRFFFSRSSAPFLLLLLLFHLINDVYVSFSILNLNKIVISLPPSSSSSLSVDVRRTEA